MRVVSVPGRLVRDPVSRRVIDEAGINVSPFDPTWTRLIADGDVTVAPDEAPAPDDASAEEAAPKEIAE